MTLSSELQYFRDLYEALRHRLFDCGGASSRRTSDAVFANEELISRVGQLSERVSEIASHWHDIRDRLDAGRRGQIEGLAAAVSAQLLQLQQLCGAHARNLDHEMQQISRELGELERGSRYLASARPVKTNFPKFVDSTG